MRVSRGTTLLLASLSLAAVSRGQGFTVLDLSGSSGVTYVGGNAVAAAGDVDGDGIADVILGAPTPHDGIGRARIYSGATGSQIHLFASAVPNDRFGYSVTGAGDLDGDGLSDVVVGAIHSSAGGATAAGRATAFSGASGAVLWFRDGTAAFDLLGYALARIGDVDGDGIEDPAVGAIYGDVGGAFDTGRVEVLSGGSGAPIHSVDGAAVSENLGASVAGVGDVTGDGVPDFLAGAPGADPGGLTNAGRAILFSGSDGSLFQEFLGTAVGDQFGTSVGSVADVTGDGAREAIVGAPQPGVSSSGYVRVLSGATATVLFTVPGTGIFEKFGTSVSGVGDLNGDGFADLLVGAPGALGPFSVQGAGRVQVLSGNGGAPLYQIQGTNYAGFLGTSVADLDDVDGDGVADFVAGEPGQFGAPGRARIHSGANGSPIHVFQGQGTGEQFGRAAAFAGDIDGDGREDVAVGAPNAQPGFLVDAGMAAVYSAASGAVLLSVAGTAGLAQVGAAVAGLGDVNGDGTPDLAVGAPGEAFSQGSVRVLSGASGATLLTISGSMPDDRFGSSVSGTGDLDGDGVGDLVVGAPQPVGLGAGYARTHSGITGAVLSTFPGTTGGDRMGTSVAGIGDADGDGVSDLAVGAPEPGALPFIPPGQGYVRVFSGASGVLLRQIDGTFPNGLLGQAVSAAGDLDGDGLGEVLVGAPGVAVTGLAPLGAAAAYSVATGLPLYVFVGQSGERLGTAVAGGRDLDGDGVADLVVGAPGSGVSVPLSLGAARIHSGATGALLVSVPGAVAGEGLGVVVASGGDASGDGIPDLLLTSPLADPGGLVDAGRARIVSLSGLAPGTTAFGTGCSGTGGFVPAIATFGGTPAPGNGAFGVSIARARGGAPALLLFASLPDPIGVPILGCTLHLAGAVFPGASVASLGGVAGAGGEGFRLLGLGVPPAPALSGASVHLQWAVADPGSANGFFTATGGLTVVVQ